MFLPLVAAAILLATSKPPSSSCVSYTDEIAGAKLPGLILPDSPTLKLGGNFYGGKILLEP
jgi:hypothetical protein